jgi:hypothetical protein
MRFLAPSLSQCDVSENVFSVSVSILNRSFVFISLGSRPISPFCTKIAAVFTRKKIAKKNIICYFVVNKNL